MCGGAAQRVALVVAALAAVVDSHFLDLSLADIAYSDLAGRGPDTAPRGSPQGLRFRGATRAANAQLLDLVVVAGDGYTPYDSSKNVNSGVAKQVGNINFKFGTRAELTFTFLAPGTGESAQADEFYFTIFVTGTHQTVQVHDFNAYYCHSSTALRYRTLGDSALEVWLASSSPAPSRSGPHDPYHLEREEEERAITFLFRGISSFLVVAESVEPVQDAGLTLAFSGMPLYNCWDRLWDWGTLWPCPKRRWCCEHFRRTGVWPVGKQEDRCRDEATLCQAPVIVPEALASKPIDATTVTTTSTTPATIRAAKNLAEATASSSAATATTSPAASPYHCKDLSTDVTASWTDSMKVWCCEHEQLGCSMVVAPAGGVARTSPAPYNCTAGQGQNWSRAKREWCCERDVRWCSAAGSSPGQGGPEAEYDCEAGLWNWVKGWSDGKKAWCCKHKLAWCPAETQFDCNIGLSHFSTAWSSAKRHWCCRAFKLGCPRPFNCLDGRSAWESNWSEAKAAWCCRNENAGCRGCDMSCSVEGLVARCADRIDWTWEHRFQRLADTCGKAHGWVLAQCPSCAECRLKDACPDCTDRALGDGGCAGSGTRDSGGSSTTNGSAGGDGAAGRSEAPETSPMTLADHLASIHRVTSSTTTTVFTEEWCQTDLAGPYERKMWCCRNMGLRCPDLFPPYDCSSGSFSGHPPSEEDTAAWPESKKAWCCHHEGNGCAVPEADPQQGTCIRCLKKAPARAALREAGIAAPPSREPWQDKFRTFGGGLPGGDWRKTRLFMALAIVVAMAVFTGVTAIRTSSTSWSVRIPQAERRTYIYVALDPEDRHTEVAGPGSASLE